MVHWARDEADAVLGCLTAKQSVKLGDGITPRAGACRIALASTGFTAPMMLVPPPGVPAARRGGAMHALLGIPSVLRAAS